MGMASKGGSMKDINEQLEKTVSMINKHYIDNSDRLEKFHHMNHWVVNDRTNLAKELIAEFQNMIWRLEEEKLTETCYSCKAFTSNWTGSLTYVIAVIDNKMRKETI